MYNYNIIDYIDYTNTHYDYCYTNGWTQLQKVAWPDMSNLMAGQRHLAPDFWIRDATLGSLCKRGVQEYLSHLSCSLKVMVVSTIVMMASSSSWHHSQPEPHHSSLQSIGEFFSDKDRQLSDLGPIKSVFFRLHIRGRWQEEVWKVWKLLSFDFTSAVDGKRKEHQKVEFHTAVRFRKWPNCRTFTIKRISSTIKGISKSESEGNQREDKCYIARSF